MSPPTVQSSDPHHARGGAAILTHPAPPPCRALFQPGHSGEQQCVWRLCPAHWMGWLGAASGRFGSPSASLISCTITASSTGPPGDAVGGPAPRAQKPWSSWRPSRAENVVAGKGRAGGAACGPLSSLAPGSHLGVPAPVLTEEGCPLVFQTPVPSPGLGPRTQPQC